MITKYLPVFILMAISGLMPERLDAAEQALASAVAEVTSLRDERLPAVAGRTDVLIDRLAEQLEEVASLVERILLREPLPVLPASPEEERLATSLARIQPALVEAFRGDEGEISHRLDRYLPVLAECEPVLDLGCGRGELLLLLREAGIEATGVEADPALALGARRRGVTVVESDAVAYLAKQPAGAWGAITAIHLLEHLDSGAQLALLEAAYRALRPGGTLIVECPNPHNLRVGATLFWLDPTHRRPLPPETLAVMLRATGFRVGEADALHPFPAEQRLAVAGDGDSPLELRLERLEGRLDELLNGPRDFALRATKPAAEEQ